MSSGQSITIPSNPNPKSVELDNYQAKRGRPMLFQISDPVTQSPLYPVLLALHINPQTFSEKMQKSKNVVATYGGFVEFIWPDELDTLSADQTSGAFVSPRTGLIAASPSGALDRGRQGTIAWERQEDLLELFRCNGAVFNGQGRPVLRGRVLCIFDRGIFAGHFTTFQVTESDEKAFTFQLNWEFRVEQTIYRYPNNARGTEFTPDVVTPPQNVTPDASILKSAPEAAQPEDPIVPKPDGGTAIG